MVRKAVAAAAVAAAFLMVAAAPASAQRVRVGTLNCDISAGIGFIIGSNRSVVCTFIPERGGPPETYHGSISRIGLDIGVTAGAHMVWAVYSEFVGPVQGALAGEYVGASGEATIAAGLGANVLVGGSSRAIALQPVSLQGQVGLNVAVGVADLRLRPGR